MSALVPKADIERGAGHVRFVPKADSSTAAKRPPRSPHRPDWRNAPKFDVHHIL